MAFITTGHLKSILSADNEADYIEISRFDKRDNQYYSYKITVGNFLSNALTGDWYEKQNQNTIEFSEAMLTDYVDLASHQAIVGTKDFQYQTAVQSDIQTAVIGSIQADSIVVQHSAEFKNSLTCNGYMYGIAMSACWADLAEYYDADDDYKPGTLVKFGGRREVTLADSTANAVVTSRPGFILNANLPAVHKVGLALAGRTPVRIKGRVKKFDRIFSAGDGLGHAAENGKPVAVALESNEQDGEKLVMCAVLFTI